MMSVEGATYIAAVNLYGCYLLVKRSVNTHDRNTRTFCMLVHVYTLIKNYMVAGRVLHTKLLCGSSNEFLLCCIHSLQFKLVIHLEVIILHHNTINYTPHVSRKVSMDI